MRPFKSINGPSKWLIRIALTASIYTTSFNVFKSFAFNSVNYFIHLFLIVFGVLIFIGGFVSKHTLTVVSALFISMLFGILILSGLNAPLHALIGYGTLLSIALFFLSNGNK